MKITFIHPNLDGIPTVPNLGLAYLISSAEKKHKVSLIDLTFHAYVYRDYLINGFKENPPEVAGISVTTFSFQAGLKIASLIKRLYPKASVIFGGVHPTLLPEETLSHPEVDAVCIGEGEETILEYLNCLQNHLSLRGIAGLWYKEDGQIIKNPLRPFKQDLDNLPFPNWDYWEIDKYLDTSGYFLGSLPIFTTRGCIYNCTFCSDPAIRRAIPGIYYRLRNPQNIVREIKVNRQKYGEKFRGLAMCDETFGVNPEHLDRFCKLYVKEGLNKEIIWSCGVRPDIVTAEWASKIAKAGCAVVSFGIESGDDYMRKNVYGKNITYQQIKDATRYLRENGIRCYFNFIIGGPGETKENIRKSRKLVAELNPIDAFYHFYQPLPRTELSERIKRIPIERLNLSSSPPLKFWDMPMMPTANFKKADLRKIMWQIRLENIFRFIKQGLKIKGLQFILDMVKYIMNIGGRRTLSLRNPYARVDLIRKTIHRYVQDNFYLP